MQLVKFESGRNGSVLTRIDGKICFPERTGPQPKDNERWLVEIAGQNPKGTVMFLKCVRLFFGTLQDCRFAGAEEKVSWPLGQVFFWLNGQIIGKFAIADVPEYADEYARRQKERETAIAALKDEAAKIRKKIAGYELETREVFATGYAIEVLEDEDFGLHRADEGYSIRVTPLYDGAEESPYRSTLEQAASEYYGEQCSWLDIEEAAEEESYLGDGPNMALMDLARDRVYRDYAKLRVSLSPEQIKEIDRAYPDRNRRHEFSTTTVELWQRK